MVMRSSQLIGKGLPFNSAGYLIGPGIMLVPAQDGSTQMVCTTEA